MSFCVLLISNYYFQNKKTKKPPKKEKGEKEEENPQNRPKKSWKNSDPGGNLSDLSKIVDHSVLYSSCFAASRVCSLVLARWILILSSWLCASEVLSIITESIASVLLTLDHRNHS